MNPIGKVLWYFESHFGGETLRDDIAKVTGVSRYRTFMTCQFRKQVIATK
jgi:hypothetical protein